MSATTVRLAVIQMSCEESRERNIERSVERIQSAASQGAQLVCLQELFATRYPCQSEDHRQFDLAESIPGETSRRLCDLAGQLDIALGESLFEQRAPGVYHNTAIVIDEGELRGMYRKMHIPDDPFYYEKFYFTPGDLGFRSHATRFGKVGVCVCWDQWFPEAARLTALTGAQILVYPTAIGWIPDEKEEFGVSQHSAWETMMRSHAIANGAFVAAPNRVGREENIEFWGASFVCNPNGEVMRRAGHDEEATLLVDINLDQVDAVRTHWPFLRDRRIDAYDGLTLRWLDDE